MALADDIKEMNEIGGAAPAAATPPVQTPATPTPAPAAVEPKVTPPPANPPAPQAQEPIKNPPFVKEPPKEASKPVQTPAAAQPAAAATEPAKTPDDLFQSRLSELTGGTVKDQKELGRILGEHKQLAEQAQKGFEPKFKSERAKWVHNLISQNEGAEAGALMRVLRAAEFKPEGKTEKEVLYEAYLLDPNNSDLSPLKAQEYFEAEYEDKYKDVANNLVAQRKLAIDVKSAKEAIQKLQSGFKATEQQPYQISKDMENHVAGVVGNFGGVKLSFSDNPQENEYLNVEVSDPQVLQAIQQEILDPTQAHANYLSQFDFNTPKGWEDYTRDVYERNNHRELRQKAFEHGGALERIKMANELRNASQPKTIDQQAAPAAAAAPSFLGSWADAAQKKAS